VVLMEHRQFTPDQFRIFHPGGKLGARLAKVRDLMHADLPLVVGQGADAAAPAILPLIAQRPRLASQVDALVRVDDRRWDVLLKNGGLIRLPAQDQEAALITLDGLDSRRRLFDLGFELVDLRTPGNLVVQGGAVGSTARPGEASGASA
jgi:cell division septal protein FtsQ